MNKIYYVAAVLSLIGFACEKEGEKVEPELKEDDLVEVAQPNKAYLLAGDEMKLWKLNEDGEDCLEDVAGEAARLADNQYQFHADNSFTFENGEITESACYGDLAKLVGNWHFNEAEDSLFVLITGKIQDGETIIFDETEQNYLMETKILELTEEGLELQQTWDGEDFQFDYSVIH